jgi:hypothetical protein
MTQTKKERANENSAEFSKHFSLREKAIEEGIWAICNVKSIPYTIVFRSDAIETIKKVVDTYADEVNKQFELLKKVIKDELKIAITKNTDSAKVAVILLNGVLIQIKKAQRGELK